MSSLFKKTLNVDNKWFFTDLHPIFKLFLFFVRGDLIVLLPFLFFILGIGLFSIRFMLLILGLYIAVRYVGEMMYWFLQQFHDKKYRPFDFGFTNLNNEAIYIIYQTFATVGVVMGVTIVIATWFYLF